MAVLIAAVLLLTGLQTTVFATGDNPVVKVENVSAAAGETVDVNVKIQKNPGILGATFQVSFPSQLTLVNAKSGDAFSALTMTKPGELTSPCNFVWDGQEITSSDIKDGVILTLSFTVPADAKAGDSYEIGISCKNGDIVDGDLNPVQVTCTGGSITVSSSGGSLTAKGTRSDTGLTVDINSPQAYESAYLILASYSDAGKMLDCEVSTIALVKGENTFSFDGTAKDTTFKAFLTDGRFRPLCPTITFAADDQCRITVSQVSAHPGDTGIVVSASVQNNPGILGMTLTLSYDKNALTLKSAAKGEAVSALSMTSPGVLTSPCNFVWDGQELSASDIKDGTIMTLTFDIPPGASKGTYPISLTYTSGDIIDNDLSPVDVSIHNGSITVVK